MSDMVGNVVDSLGEISPSSKPEGNTYDQLINGPIHWFSDWPTGDVPRLGAAVYPIWNREVSFIYVGMSGRSFTGGNDCNGKAGPWGRLKAVAHT